MLGVARPASLPGQRAHCSLNLYWALRRDPDVSVCRPEIKQMTFIGKAIFFPQCLSVRRIDRAQRLLTGKDENSLLPIFFGGKKGLWRLMNKEPQLTMSGRACSWLPAHNRMDRN